MDAIERKTLTVGSYKVRMVFVFVAVLWLIAIVFLIMSILIRMGVINSNSENITVDDGIVGDPNADPNETMNIIPNEYTETYEKDVNWPQYDKPSRFIIDIDYTFPEVSTSNGGIIDAHMTGETTTHGFEIVQSGLNRVRFNVYYITGSELSVTSNAVSGTVNIKAYIDYVENSIRIVVDDDIDNTSALINPVALELPRPYRFPPPGCPNNCNFVVGRNNQNFNLKLNSIRIQTT